MNKLAQDPQLCNASGNDQGKLCFPHSYVVVLTNITRKQLDDALTEGEQSLEGRANVHHFREWCANNSGPIMSN